MSKKHFLATVIIFILCFAVNLHADYAIDDFSTPHNYLTQGVAGTIWEGVYGVGNSTSNEVFAITSDVNNGKLMMDLYGNVANVFPAASYTGDAAPGVYLRIMGDFSMETKVTRYDYPVDHLSCGLIVSDEETGCDQMWYAYFARWTSHMLWTYEDCVRNNEIFDIFAPGEQWGIDHPCMRMEKIGDTFTTYYSDTNGIDWTLDSTYTRAQSGDMDGVVLRAGLFANNAGSRAKVEFDYFQLTCDEILHTPYDPYPPNGGQFDILQDCCLCWTPGDFADSYMLYLGTDPNDFNEPEHPPIIEYPETGPLCHPVGGLEFGQTYYWRVDEVNATHIDSPWKGDLWQFTVKDHSIIEDYQRYTETGDPAFNTEQLDDGVLRKTWIDGYWAVLWDIGFAIYPPSTNDASNGSLAILDTSVSKNGTQSMKMYFDNDGTCTYLPDLYGYTGFTYEAPYYSEVYAAIDDAAKIDPTPGDQPPPPLGSGGDIYEAQDTQSLELNSRDFSIFKILQLSLLGDPNNDEEDLYLVMADDDGDEVLAIYPDTITEDSWQDWLISLVDLAATNPNFDLDNVALIYLGIGNRYAATPGGSGAVWFDDIKLLAYSLCVPDYYAVPNADITNDCMVNNDDLEAILAYWLEEIGSISKADDFSTAYDYLANGPAGIWDGIIDTNADSIEAVSGILYMKSTGNRWGPGLDEETGLFLYKNIDRSFTATIKIVDANNTGENKFSSASLMVRAANLSDAGPGEDWFSFDFLPSWDIGPIGRAANDGIRIDLIGRADNTTLPQYFKIVYIAQTGDFYCSYSIDNGATYIPLTGGSVNAYPYSREDLANIPLQVGPAHSTWFDITDYAVFDDFEITSVNSPQDYDLYIDGEINFKDIAVLADSWLVGPILLGD